MTDIAQQLLTQDEQGVSHPIFYVEILRRVHDFEGARTSEWRRLPTPFFTRAGAVSHMITCSCLPSEKRIAVESGLLDPEWRMARESLLENRWRRVAEEPPIEDGYHLVTDGNEGGWMAMYIHATGQWSSGGCVLMRITHWRPVPALPKEQT